MDDGYYDVAQICENGHVANSMAHDYPDSNQDHCDKCGAPTIMDCPSCQIAIRAPAFCYKCGKPFPWTNARLRAAEDLADELDDITSDERESLKKSSGPEDSQHPRCRNAIQKDHAEGGKSMRALLKDIVSEAVRKTIFGP